MKMTLDDIQGRESRHVLQTYRRQPVAFVRGSGPRLYDVDGREYLDFVSGIGVASLGHAHPGLAAAIAILSLPGSCLFMDKQRPPLSRDLIHWRKASTLKAARPCGKMHGCHAR